MIPFVRKTEKDEKDNPLIWVKNTREERHYRSKTHAQPPAQHFQYTRLERNHLQLSLETGINIFGGFFFFFLKKHKKKT